MTTKNVLKKIIKNGVEFEIDKSKIFAITEDMVTVTTDSTKWVSPYNTSYWYTNITINADSWIEWIEWAVYTFIINTKMVVTSAYRNVRVRIGTSWSWKPMMTATSSILWWSGYFVKTRTDLYVYKSTYQSGWALHLNNDTSYSAMSVTEWQTGTATSARVMRADYLKQIIEYHAGNLHDSTKQDTLTAGDWITITNNVISSNWWGAISNFVNWSALATNTKSLTSSGTESITLDNSTSLIVINWYIDWFSWMNNFGQWIFMMLTKNNTIWYIRLWNWNVITLTADFTNHSLSIVKTITWTVWNWSITIKEF